MDRLIESMRLGPQTPMKRKVLHDLELLSAYRKRKALEQAKSASKQAEPPSKP